MTATRVSPPNDESLLAKIFRAACHYGIWFELGHNTKDKIRISANTYEHAKPLRPWLRVAIPLMNYAMEVFKLTHPEVYATWELAYRNLLDWVKPWKGKHLENT